MHLILMGDQGISFNVDSENPEKLLYSQATCQRDSVWVEAKESHSRHRQFDDRNLRTPQKQIRPLHNSHVPQGQQQRGQALKRREQLPPDRAPRYKKQSFHKQQEDGHIQNGSQQQNSRRARPLPPRLARDQKGISPYSAGVDFSRQNLTSVDAL